jgi:chromosome segregation ATPase
MSSLEMRIEKYKRYVEIKEDEIIKLKERIDDAESNISELNLVIKARDQKDEIRQAQIQAITNDFQQKEEEYKKALSYLRDENKRIDKYSRVFDKMPLPIKQIEEEMRFFDAKQLDVLIKYLEKDSYEFIKNVSKTINGKCERHYEKS